MSNEGAETQRTHRTVAAVVSWLAAPINTWQLVTVPVATSSTRSSFYTAPLAPGTLLRRLPEPWQGLSADHDDGAFGDHAPDAVWSRDNDLVFAVFEVGNDVQAGADLALQR